MNLDYKDFDSGSFSAETGLDDALGLSTSFPVKSNKEQGSGRENSLPDIMGLQEVIFSCLLIFVHFVFDVYDKIVNLFALIFTKKQDMKALLDTTKQLTKLPSSISFICPSHDVRNQSGYQLEEKLVHIIKWCAIIGIPYVSIYDQEGEFIKRKTYFEHRLKYLNRMPDSSHGHKHGYQLTVMNGFKESFFGLKDIGTHSVRVHFLSEEDGREHIVKVAKDLIRETNPNNNQNHNHNQNHNQNNNENNNPNSNQKDLEIGSVPVVTVSSLEERMTGEFDFPDPEVVVQLSPIPCLFGFLPWQIRLSEIFPLPDCDAEGDPTGASVLQAFTNVLFKYSKCEQRFGS